MRAGVAAEPGVEILGEVLTPAVAEAVHGERLLGLAARASLQRTAYLLPIFSAFADDLLRIRNSLRRRNVEVHLFLRDAVVFWPRLVGTGRTHFLAYSRDDQVRGANPVVVREDSRGGFGIDHKPDLSGSLLVDAGLWGSLVRSSRRWPLAGR